jgi:hypothetical protein
MTVLRMIQRGDLKGQQVCKGAPWVIKAEDVAAFHAEKRSQGPLTPNPAQRSFNFQGLQGIEWVNLGVIAAEACM